MSQDIVPSGVAAAGVPFTLPAEWRWEPFGDTRRIVYFRNGDQTASLLPPKDVWPSKQLPTTDKSLAPLPYGQERARDDVGEYIIDHVSKRTYRPDSRRHSSVTPTSSNAPSSAAGTRQRRLSGSMDALNLASTSSTITVLLQRHPTYGYGFIVGGSDPVQVRHVDKGGPAAKASPPLRNGDCIVRIGKEDVRHYSVDQIAAAIRSQGGQGLEVTIERTESELERSGSQHSLEPPPVLARGRSKSSVAASSAAKQYTLKVIVEDGLYKTVFCDPTTTIEETTATVVEKMQLKSSNIYGLFVDSAGVSSSWLLPTDLTGQALGCKEGGHVQCWLRVRFVPDDFEALASQDAQGFDILFSQTQRAVTQALYSDLTFEAALRLAGVQVQLWMLQNHKKKVDLSQLEKHAGLSTFLAPKFLKQARQKDLKKALVAPLQKGTTSEALKLDYVCLAASLVRTFGCESFQVVMDKRDVCVVVGARDGVARVISTSLVTPIVHYRDISGLKIAPAPPGADHDEGTWCLRIELTPTPRGRTPQPIDIFGQQATLQRMAALLEGYYRNQVGSNLSRRTSAFQKKPPPVSPKPRRSTSIGSTASVGLGNVGNQSPAVDLSQIKLAKKRISETVTMPPPRYLSVHKVVPESWSYVQPAGAHLKPNESEPPEAAPVLLDLTASLPAPSAKHLLRPQPSDPTTVSTEPASVVVPRDTEAALAQPCSVAVALADSKAASREEDSVFPNTEGGAGADRDAHSNDGHKLGSGSVPDITIAVAAAAPSAVSDADASAADADADASCTEQSASATETAKPVARPSVDPMVELASALSSRRESSRSVSEPEVEAGGNKKKRVRQFVPPAVVEEEPEPFVFESACAGMEDDVPFVTSEYAGAAFLDGGDTLDELLFIGDTCGQSDEESTSAYAGPMVVPPGLAAFYTDQSAMMLDSDDDEADDATGAMAGHAGRFDGFATAGEHEKDADVGRDGQRVLLDLPDNSLWDDVLETSDNFASVQRQRTNISICSLNSHDPSDTFPVLESPAGFRDDDDASEFADQSDLSLPPPPPPEFWDDDTLPLPVGEAPVIPPPDFDDLPAPAAPVLLAPSSPDDAAATASTLQAAKEGPLDARPERSEDILSPPSDNDHELTELHASPQRRPTLPGAHDQILRSERPLECDATILKLEGKIADFRVVVDMAETGDFCSADHPEDYAQFKSQMWDACKSLVMSTRSIVTGATDEHTLGQAAALTYDYVAQLCDAACEAAENLDSSQLDLQLMLLRRSTDLADAVNETLIVARGAVGLTVDDPVMRLVLDKTKRMAQLISQLMKVLRDK